MEGDITGKFRGLSVEIVADREIFKKNDAVFIRCAGAKLVLVFIVERENDPAEDFAFVVLLGDLDGTACRFVQSRSGNNLPICGKEDLLGAPGGNISVRGFCLLVVVVSEREAGENNHACLIRRAFGDLVEGHVIDCKLSALQRRVCLRVYLEDLQSTGGFVVDDRLGDDLTVFRDLDRILRKCSPPKRQPDLSPTALRSCFLLRCLSVALAARRGRTALCGEIAVAHGFHRDRFDVFTVIDGLAVLINRPPFNSGLPGYGVPLAAAAVLHRLEVSARLRITCAVEEHRAGAVRMPHLKVPITASGVINGCDRLLIAGHEVLEQRLVVSCREVRKDLGIRKERRGIRARGAFCGGKSSVRLRNRT